MSTTVWHVRMIGGRSRDVAAGSADDAVDIAVALWREDEDEPWQVTRGALESVERMLTYVYMAEDVIAS